MSNYISIKEAAAILGKSESQLRRLCQTGRYRQARKAGKTWEIAKTADVRFMGITIPPDKFDKQQVWEISPTRLQEAQVKAGHVTAANRFADDYVKNYQGGRDAAIIVYAMQHSLKERTLRRWMAEYAKDGIMALVDRRGFLGEALRISPGAWECFKSLYLDPRQPSVKSCWLNLSYLNQSKNLEWTIPSLRTMQILADKIPQPLRILAREGQAAYEARCAPYIEKDFTSIEPGEIWIGDHHQFNIWVRSGGTWVRPWLTAWMDMRSRVMMGWHISTAPHQTTILRAFRRGVEDYGPPVSVKIDNGRDYDSQMWTGTTKMRRREWRRLKIEFDEQLMTGLYAMMGVSVSFAIPYHPQSKAIERLFDTVDQQFCKTFKTYCGKDVDRRPEGLNDYLQTTAAIQEAYDLAGFKEKFREYIAVYHETPHQGEGMNGKSPMTVLSRRTSRRVIEDETLALLCRAWSGVQKVGKNGVSIRGVRYGQYNRDLQLNFGRDIKISYDPDDMQQVWVYDAQTMQLITIAEQNRLLAYGETVNEEHLREAMREKTKAKNLLKQHYDASLTANMDLTDLAIKAMRAAEKAGNEDKDEKTIANLRPVRTPLDRQIDFHKKMAMRNLKQKLEREERVKLFYSLERPTPVPPPIKLDLNLTRNAVGDELTPTPQPNPPKRRNGYSEDENSWEDSLWG